MRKVYKKRYRGHRKKKTNWHVIVFFAIAIMLLSIVLAASVWGKASRESSDNNNNNNNNSNNTESSDYNINIYEDTYDIYIKSGDTLDLINSTYKQVFMPYPISAQPTISKPDTVIPVIRPMILPDATVMPTVEEPKIPSASNEKPTVPPPTTEPPATAAATAAPAAAKPTETTAAAAVPVAPIPTAPPILIPKDGNGAMIALTFDDGPSNYTNRIVEILAENDAKATFCVLGNRVANFEKTVKNIAEQGSQIIGHSWSHSDFRKIRSDQIIGELRYTNDAIFKITGIKPTLYRAPYGAYNANVKKISKDEGMSLIQWNVDPNDWRYRNENTVYNNIVSSVTEGAIILCHDIHATTLAAMERVIPILVEKGWKLVTVEELLGETEPGVVYYSATKSEK